MQVAILPGGRLHLHDGPIDLIVGAEGEAAAVRAGFAAAVRRFATVLDELCEELPLLRAEMLVDSPLPEGVVAKRMHAAVRPLCDARFLTRMAAVAGSVADEILAAICVSAPLVRAWVNNGGDIALHLGAGAAFDVGMVGVVHDSRSSGLFSENVGQYPRPHAEERAQPASRSMAARAPCGPSFETQTSSAPQDEVVERHSPPATLFGTTRIHHNDPVRGVATSGFGGRSFSLGIADAVTILAKDAASADAVATLIANAVDLPDHPAIRRAPARDFDPQSDLGERLVTREVGALTDGEIAAALDAGVQEAERLRDGNHLFAAALNLRGQVRTIGALESRSNLPQVSHV